jgi:predicted kinase
MKTLLILQGLPASGKSTYAVNWVNEDPEHRLRINQDSIRRMFGKYWLEDKIQLKKRESITSNIIMELLKQSMFNQFDIVLDNMNLNSKVLGTIEDYVNYFNMKFVDSQAYKIEYKLFKEPLNTLINRDSKRDIPVGAEVITNLYNKYYDIVNCTDNNTGD